MTVIEAITLVDRLRPNRFTAAEKYRWLSDIDGLICRELIETHGDSPLKGPFEGYTEGLDDNAVLIAPFPYDALYRWYLESQIDLCNGEITRYNNSRNLFNHAYLTYTDWYNRTHMPVQAGNFRFTEGRKAGEKDALAT